MTRSIPWAVTEIFCTRNERILRIKGSQFLTVLSPILATSHAVRLNCVWVIIYVEPSYLKCWRQMLLNIDVISSVLPHSYMLLTSYSCNAETFDHNQNHANRFVYKLNLTLWSWSINQLELIAQYLEKTQVLFHFTFTLY